MKTNRYAVLRVGDEWRIVTEHQQIGHFRNRGLALEAALRFAHHAADSGRPVEILYTDVGAQLHSLRLPGLRIPTDRSATVTRLEPKARSEDRDNPAPLRAMA